MGDIEYIDFRTEENYYFSILELVTKIIKKPETQHIIQEFRDEYEGLQSSLSGNAVNNTKSNNQTQLNIHNNKLFTTTNAILITFCIIIIFAIYVLSYKKNVVNSTISFREKTHSNAITWNLPYHFEHYTERIKITKPIWNKFQETKNALVGLYGLGGVGKTTLAKYIIHNPQQNYEFRAWFSAETKELLQADYFKLSKEYQLFTKKC